VALALTLRHPPSGHEVTDPEARKWIRFGASLLRVIARNSCPLATSAIRFVEVVEEKLSLKPALGPMDCADAILGEHVEEATQSLSKPYLFCAEPVGHTVGPKSKGRLQVFGIHFPGIQAILSKDVEGFRAFFDAV